jgi:hypothetical protein
VVEIRTAAAWCVEKCRKRNKRIKGISAVFVRLRKSHDASGRKEGAVGRGNGHTASQGMIVIANMQWADWLSQLLT